MECFYDGSKGLLKGDLRHGNTVEIKIYAKEVIKANLVFTEQIFSVYSKAKKISIDMKSVDGGFVCSLCLPVCPIRYFFELFDGKRTVIYTPSGVSEFHVEGFDDDFIIVSDFDVPNWAKGAVWYQIMPDSFFNGDTIVGKSNANGTFVNPWGGDRLGMHDYYGGDLYGIAKKVDYIKSLGVDVVSINPIWMTNHQAGYGSFDLEQVDAAFGGESGLKHLIDVLHKNGIKVVLDGVFQYYHKYGKLLNGANVFPFDTKKQIKHNSKMFICDSLGKVVDGTWGHPTIDYSSEEARDIVAGKNSPIKRYLQAGADGWRLDVGNTYEGSNQDNYGTCDTALGFIYDSIKAIDKDKLVLTEHPWGEMFSSGKCESKWNYAFGYPLRDWASGRIDNITALKRINTAVFSLPRPVAQASFNFITTHDLSRILYYCNGDTMAMKAAIVIQFAFVGAPSIYSGDEIGIVGMPAEFVNSAAPSSFGSFEWNEEKQNRELLGIYKQITNLRREKEGLFTDGLCYSCCCGKNAIAVIRSNHDDTVISIAGNIKNELIEISSSFIQDGNYKDIVSGDCIEVKNGKLSFGMNYPGCAIFAKDFCNKFLNEFEVDGDIYYNGNKYILSKNSTMNSFVYGCFELEVGGSALIQVGSISVEETHFTINGKNYVKCGNIKIVRDENDVVFIFNQDNLIVSEKTFDAYTVPVVVKGEGEFFFVGSKSIRRKLVADKQHGFNGMFNAIEGGVETGSIENDFSATIELCLDGRVEVVTDGAGIGISQVGKDVTFYRRVSDNIEIINTAKKCQKIAIERFGNVISAYVVSKTCVRKIGELKVNYSSSKLKIKGQLKSLVFGDGINQAVPLGKNKIWFNGAKDETARKLFSLKQISGVWKGCQEGILLDSTRGSFVSEKEYDDLELFFTLYGKLDVKLSNTKINFKSDCKTNYCVKKKGYEIRIYSGQPLVFCQSLKCDCKKSNILFESKTKGCEFSNFWIQEYGAVWTIERGNCFFNTRNELRFTSNGGDFYVSSSRAFSDLLMTANIRFNKAESRDDGDFFILLGHSPFLKEKNGFAIRITHSKQVEILQNGQVISSQKVEDLDVNSFFVRVQKTALKLKINIAPSYYNKAERRVVDIVVPCHSGGNLAFYGRHISGAVSDFYASSMVDAKFTHKKVSVAKPTYIWLC